MKKVKLIEVHIDDFLFGIVALQTDGNDPLNGLLEESLGQTFDAGGVQLFGQLLRDGTTATTATLAHQSAFHNGPEESTDIDSAVIREAHVLRGYERLNQIGGQILIAGIKSVVLAVGKAPETLSVGRNELRSIAIYRIFELLHSRHIANPSLRDGKEDDEHECRYTSCGDPDGGNEALSTARRKVQLAVRGVAGFAMRPRPIGSEVSDVFLYLFHIKIEGVDVIANRVGNKTEVSHRLAIAVSCRSVVCRFRPTRTQSCP